MLLCSLWYELRNRITKIKDDLFIEVNTVGGNEGAFPAIQILQKNSDQKNRFIPQIISTTGNCTKGYLGSKYSNFGHNEVFIDLNSAAHASCAKTDDLGPGLKRVKSGRGGARSTSTRG